MSFLFLRNLFYLTGVWSVTNKSGSNILLAYIKGYVLCDVPFYVGDRIYSERGTLIEM